MVFLAATTLETPIRTQSEAFKWFKKIGGTQTRINGFILRENLESTVESTVGSTGNECFSHQLWRLSFKPSRHFSDVLRVIVPALAAAQHVKSSTKDT